MMIPYPVDDIGKGDQSVPFSFSICGGSVEPNTYVYRVINRCRNTVGHVCKCVIKTVYQKNKYYINIHCYQMYQVNDAPVRHKALSLEGYIELLYYFYIKYC